MADADLDEVSQSTIETRAHPEPNQAQIRKARLAQLQQQSGAGAGGPPGGQQEDQRK